MPKPGMKELHIQISEETFEGLKSLSKHYGDFSAIIRGILDDFVKRLKEAEKEQIEETN